MLQENEVREFTGWIQGRPEDYIMNLQRQQHRSKAQSNTRKSAIGVTAPKLNLFSPGIKNNYEYLIQKQNEVANFTYKKGKVEYLKVDILRLKDQRSIQQLNRQALKMILKQHIATKQPACLLCL